jgi:hypothetical protein
MPWAGLACGSPGSPFPPPPQGSTTGRTRVHELAQPPTLPGKLVKAGRVIRAGRCKDTAPIECGQGCSCMGVGTAAMPGWLAGEECLRLRHTRTA